MMKCLLAVLMTLVFVGFALAQMADPNKLVYDESENPSNWCRNGLFPAMDKDYRLGQIIRNSNLLTDDMDTCPSADPAKCDVDRRMKAGIFVAVSRKLDDFYCIFDPRKLTAGWLAAKDIRLMSEAVVEDARWIGKWTTGHNESIEITKVVDGLEVSGEAQWFGLTNQFGEQVVHDGALYFIAKPVSNRLVLRVDSDYLCAAELIHIGRFLVVRDNGYCGGANVRFNGVYRRKK
jgi:hypothetical protein